MNKRFLLSAALLMSTILTGVAPVANALTIEDIITVNEQPDIDTHEVGLSGVLAAHAEEDKIEETTKDNISIEEEKDVTVVIKKGDNLSKIALEHNTTYERLYLANQSIKDPNIVYPGQEIRIPLSDEELPDRPLPVTSPVKTPSQKNTPTPPRSYAPAVSSVGCNTGNPYKDFIYAKESGCNPAAVNKNGCRGIGQACPGSKLPCAADFACQDAYFSQYAINRYGSWEAAYNYWQSHHWW